MGIQVIGSGGVVVGAGEETRKPLHTSSIPMTGNWYRYAGNTGTIAAATGAGSEVFQFRWLSGTKSFALVHKVMVTGVGVVAVATATGPLGWELVPARAWTAAGSGGTRIAISADNLQTETALPTPQVNDMGIATTGALTAGTKSLDANAQGNLIISVGTGAVTTINAATLVQPTALWDADGEGFQPLVLANQEGFVVRTTHAGPTALTYTLGIKVIWSEVTAY